MTLYSLASSSSGNCYLYDFGDIKILIDIGIRKKNLLSKLEEINLSFDDISEIFITHEHIDHIMGLEVINKTNTKTINLTYGTDEFIKYNINNKNHIKSNDKICVGDVIVEVIPTSHDATESVSYIFHHNNKKYVHLLDTGYIINSVCEKIKNAHFYLIESNYDHEVLISNLKYPLSVKKRIISDQGHLSNQQCYEYLCELTGRNTEIVCFGHLSENNNSKDNVSIQNIDLDGFEKVILDKDETVKVICK